MARLQMCVRAWMHTGVVAYGEAAGSGGAHTPSSLLRAALHHLGRACVVAAVGTPKADKRKAYKNHAMRACTGRPCAAVLVMRRGAAPAALSATDACMWQPRSLQSGAAGAWRMLSSVCVKMGCKQHRHQLQLQEGS